MVGTPIPIFTLYGISTNAGRHPSTSPDRLRYIFGKYT
jgi:hypothetical protein